MQQPPNAVLRMLAARNQQAETAVPVPRVYTVAEVATMLGVSLGGTYQLVRAGDIPAIKLGNRWVIPKKRFHAWLDNLPEDQDDTTTGKAAS